MRVELRPSGYIQLQSTHKFITLKNWPEATQCCLTESTTLLTSATKSTRIESGSRIKGHDIFLGSNLKSYFLISEAAFLLIIYIR